MISSFKSTFLLFISSLLLHSASADFICEDLPSDVCAFSISSSGKRCVLETDNAMGYQCKTSEVVVEGISGYVETEECCEACGVDRNSVGISSDTLLEPGFAVKLCSPSCYNKCPNIIDLYINLVAAEGAYLPDVCEAQMTNPRRSMIAILSSGAATAPASPEFSQAPSPAPAPI